MGFEGNIEKNWTGFGQKRAKQPFGGFRTLKRMKQTLKETLKKRKQSQEVLKEKKET